MEPNAFNLLGEKYKFIEQKRNIIYFSKYSFEVSEFQTIYNYVKAIKEHTFISVYSLGKHLVNNYIDFLCMKNNQKESEKVFIICSLFFLHYFSLFGYETNNTFDQLMTKLYFEPDQDIKKVLLLIKEFVADLYINRPKNENVEEY